MEIVESFHWQKKKKFRKNIEDYMIEHVIASSKGFEKDKHHENALNAIGVVPQTGRKLKVVFRWFGKEKVKLITAYYLD